MVQSHIYVLEVLFAAGITLGSQSLDLDKKDTWVVSIARFIMYIITVQASKAISVLLYEVLHKKRDLNLQIFNKVNRHRFMMYVLSVAIIYINNQKLYAEDLPLILIAYIIFRYPEVDMEQHELLLSIKTEPALCRHQACKLANMFDLTAERKEHDIEKENCQVISKVQQSGENDKSYRVKNLLGNKKRREKTWQASHQEPTSSLKHQGTPPQMTLGAGLAYSYIEGYLAYVIPSDGGDLKGFQDNLRAFESVHRVVFPVKRMFVIVTKSMHCPPDLKEFNDKSDRQDVNRLEACLSLEEVTKHVAGVLNRVYKNSTYKITRPPGGGPPVYVAAECATSLFTLYKVLKNRHLCDETAGVDVSTVVTDFVYTLRSALDNCPDFMNKCEVVYFDDTDESLNLADVLLDRIRKLEPDFEQFIVRKD